jgi:CheY-like chemotaxis protein
MMEVMPTRKPLSVLIVDDNKDAADTLAVYLKARGCVVRVAYDSAAGLQAAAGDPPDCAVLDLGMPKMDGFALARELRARPGTRHVPLVTLTGYADERAVAEASRVGFDHHFAKGEATPEAVLQVLTELVAARAGSGAGQTTSPPTLAEPTDR